MALRAGYYGLKKKVLNMFPTNPSAGDKLALISDIQNVYKTSGVTGAKNFLKNIATTITLDGITYTVNSDGSVKITGTATATSHIDLIYDLSDLASRGEEFTLTGLPDNIPANVSIGIYNNIGNSLQDIVENHRATITAPRLSYSFKFSELKVPTSLVDPTWSTCSIRLYVNNGVVLGETGYIIKPMLSISDDIDKSYQPYAMTNQELTASAAEQKGVINAIITAATSAADFAAFKAAMEAITPVTRSLSREASPEDVPEEVIEEKPVTKKTTRKTVKEGE